MKIEQFVRDQLTQHSGINVFPVFAPEYQPLPFAIYQRSSTTRDRVTVQAAMGPVATFQVAVYADTYNQVRDIADQIRIGFDNFTGEYNDGQDTVTVFYCFLADEADGEPTQFEGESKPAYSAMMNFLIKYKENCDGM